LSGLAAAAVWLLRRRRGLATLLSVLTTLLGAGSLGVAAFAALGGTRALWQGSWTLPFGAPAVRLDPLGGVFLLPIALIGALGAIYAPAYLRPGDGEEPVGAPLAAFELLLATLALVVVAADTVLLLMAWELMTLASWYLMVRGHEHREVRSAGLIYLVAGHVSGAALLLLFVFLAQTGAGWTVPVEPPGGTAGLPGAGGLLALALVGFGTKAAIAPLHVWLPDAHAAAPSHVSALMSGVLITLGFYGLIRFIPMLGPPPPAWGMLLMALGALGACGGIVMALSQRDVKRVLAYSTIENAGLVTLAIGAALLATALGRPEVAAIAWTAALLHLWNHAIAKSLLFFGAGAIAQAVESRDLERWGGLLRRLPTLGTTLLIGAAAVVGLPGTHGFASEWLLFMGLFRGTQETAGAARLAMLLGAVAAAFTAGAALACFVRLVGVGLLGHARSPEAAHVTPPARRGLAFPALVLASLTIGLVAALPWLLDRLGPAVESLDAGSRMATVQALAAPLPWLGVGLLGVVAAIVITRAGLRRGPSVRQGPTWDCGYAHPTPRMQYTASSLAQPVTRVLQPALRTAVRWTPPRGLWPGPLAWEARTPERALAELYRPVLARLEQVLGLFTRLQEGRVMVYLRYVGVALLALLAWLFLPGRLAR
jgi:hydrogenase-4 component B